MKAERSARRRRQRGHVEAPGVLAELRSLARRIRCTIRLHGRGRVTVMHGRQARTGALHPADARRWLQGGVRSPEERDRRSVRLRKQRRQAQVDELRCQARRQGCTVGLRNHGSVVLKRGRRELTKPLNRATALAWLQGRAELPKRREVLQAVQAELRNGEIALCREPAPPPPPPPSPVAATAPVTVDPDLRIVAALREAVVERWSQKVWDELSLDANRRLKDGKRTKPATPVSAKPTPPPVSPSKALETGRVIRAARTLKARDHALQRKDGGYVVFPLALPEPPPGSEVLSLDGVEARLIDPVWP